MGRFGRCLPGSRGAVGPSGHRRTHSVPVSPTPATKIRAARSPREGTVLTPRPGGGLHARQAQASNPGCSPRSPPRPHAGRGRTVTGARAARGLCPPTSKPPWVKLPTSTASTAAPLWSLHSPVASFGTRGPAQHTSGAAPPAPCGKEVVMTWRCHGDKTTRRLGNAAHLDGHRKRKFLPRGMQLAFRAVPLRTESSSEFSCQIEIA